MLSNLNLFRKGLLSLLLAALAGTALAATTDLSYAPSSSARHDFNHSPVGQSFTATAASVHGGLYLADETSFTNWLSTIYPGYIGTFPYAVATSVSVRIDLLSGEGPDGAVLHSTTKTLTAPFLGVLDVDYAAAGISLVVGQKYTILVTDISGQTYSDGVTGWVIPSVTDPTPGAGEPVYDSTGTIVGYTPYGAYYDGLPVLQGSLVSNDAGVGDNAFQLLDSGTTTAAPQMISGGNAVITAFVARNPGYIVVNGGQNLLDHLWTSNLNASNTTFLGGLTNWYQTGLLVDYTGEVSSQGVILTQLTVKPAPAALSVSSASLVTGTVGVAYSAPVAAMGGLPPYLGTVTGLPAGLAFDGSNITGTPTASGVFTLNVTITDSLGNTASGSPTVTITPTPASYTIKDEGKGKISAIGAGYVLVSTKKLIWDSKTVISVNTPSGPMSVIDSFVKTGMKIQWKGLRDAATNTVLTSKIEIN